MMDGLIAIVLAAGLGTRMNSDGQKVLKQLKGRSMLFYIISRLKKLNLTRIIVIIGYQGNEVEEELTGEKVEFVKQEQLLGTGHAVRQAEPFLSSYQDDILVLCGDAPLLTLSTLKNLIATHREEEAAGTILTANFPDPTGYGRILRNGDTSVEGIIEEADASSKERLIKEINTGVYVFRKGPLFTALSEIKPDNIKKEYYLTDAVRILKKSGGKISSFRTDNPDEVLGINNKEDLIRAEKILKGRFASAQ